MRKFHDVEQNTYDWEQLRLKRATSSNFTSIMAHTVKKDEFDENAKFGPPAIKYARELAHEIVTGRPYQDKLELKVFDRGHEYEPEAIELYEAETMYKVNNGGFYSFGNYGDSPDGNIGKDRSLEIKVANESVMWETIERGGYDPIHKWQIHGHMWIGNKKSCDFVRYCPEFHKPKRLYVYTVERDETIIEQLEKRMPIFWELVEKQIKILEK